MVGSHLKYALFQPSSATFRKFLLRTVPSPVAQQQALFSSIGQNEGDYRQHSLSSLRSLTDPSDLFPDLRDRLACGILRLQNFDGSMAPLLAASSHRVAMQSRRTVALLERMWCDTASLSVQPRNGQASNNLRQIRDRHAASLSDLADLVASMRAVSVTDRGFSDGGSTDDLDAFIDAADDVLSCRLAVMLLCDHGVALSRYRNRTSISHDGSSSGIISSDVEVRFVLLEAVAEAMSICRLVYDGEGPLIFYREERGDRISCGGRDGFDDYEYDNACLYNPDGDPPKCEGKEICLTLVRPYVHHALVEVLKNAMAACMRVNHKDPGHITLSLRETMDGSVILTVIDGGDGLSSHVDPTDSRHGPFGFATTGDGRRWDRLKEQTSYATVRDPMGGLEVGSLEGAD